MDHSNWSPNPEVLAQIMSMKERNPFEGVASNYEKGKNFRYKVGKKPIDPYLDSEGFFVDESGKRTRMFDSKGNQIMSPDHRMRFENAAQERFKQDDSQYQMMSQYNAAADTQDMLNNTWSDATNFAYDLASNPPNEAIPRAAEFLNATYDKYGVPQEYRMDSNMLYQIQEPGGLNRVVNSMMKSQLSNVDPEVRNMVMSQVSNMPQFDNLRGYSFESANQQNVALMESPGNNIISTRSPEIPSEAIGADNGNHFQSYTADAGTTNLKFSGRKDSKPHPFEAGLRDER